jgi:hypothetical protein
VIGNVLDLGSLVVVRQDYGIALRRQPPDLRRPVRAGLLSADLRTTSLRSASLRLARLYCGCLSIGHDVPLSPAEVLDSQCKTLFAS